MSPLHFKVMVCHAALCLRRTGGGGFSKYFPTPPGATPRSSCAALKHNPGAACAEWPTHSGTDVNTEQICLVCLKALRPVHCKIHSKIHSCADQLFQSKIFAF